MGAHLRGIKSTLQTDFPNITGAVTATQAELNILAGVTSTTAELNILDGVTATATEINKLDESARSVSNYVDATVYHLHNDTSDSSFLDMVSIAPGSSFESFGPTGSGATNEWTAMDALPSTTKAVRLKVISEASGSTNGTTYGLNLWARPGDSATGRANRHWVLADLVINRTGSSEKTRTISEFDIALDSGDLTFDLSYSEDGAADGTFVMQVYLQGFYV